MAETSLVFNILAKDQASSKFDKIKARAAILGAAIGALAVKFGKDSVTAFVEAEQAQNRLQAAFDKFPGLADTNISRLNRLNATLAQKTKFDDDATASGQAVLAQFGVTGRQLERLTPLLQDYAARTGKDLPTAAQDLGKAILGQGRALKTIGLNFEDTGSRAGNLSQLMGGLRSQVGGFAAKEGQTAAGQAAILRNQFGELQEEAGSKLVPALVKVAGALLDVIGFIDRNKAVIVPMTAAIGGLVGTIWAVNAATNAWKSAQVAWAAISKVTVVWTGAVTAAQWAWNAALTANPIGLVIVAIAALVAGLILAYKKSETFRVIVDGALRAVGGAFTWLWNTGKNALSWLGEKWDEFVGNLRAIRQAVGNILDALFNPIRSAWTAVREWIGEKWETFKEANRTLAAAVGRALDAIFDPIKTAWSSVRDWVGERWAAFKEWVGGLSLNFSGIFDGLWQAFRSAVNAIIRAWNNLSFGIPGFDPPGPGKFPGITVGTPNIPYLAQGGIVTKPTLAVVGEGPHPEAVLPLPRGMRDLASGGATTVNITINALDPVAAGTYVKRALDEHVRRNGPLRGLT